MSSNTTNGCPPRPAGVGEGKGASAPGTGGIVPYGAPTGEKHPELGTVVGIAVAALGGAVASSDASALAPALTAFGVTSAFRGGRANKIGAVAAACVCAVVFAVSLGPASMVDSLIVTVAAAVVARVLAHGRMTSGGACIAVAAISAARLADDAAFAALAGTSLQATFKAVVDALASGLTDITPTAASGLEVLRSAIALLWPTAYVVAGLGEYLFVQFGTWLASPRKEDGSQVDLPRLSEFDVPLWVVAVLAAGGIGLAVALTWADAPEVVLMASANVLLAVRFAFAAQGFGVLSWLCGTRKWGPLACVLVAVMGLILEARFFVLTVAGVVDVWANFRRLSRGGEEAAVNDAPAEQDQ